LDQSTTKRSALGRGLGALIQDARYEKKDIIAAGSINEIEVEKIEPNPFQPRTHFDEDSLIDLASSIKELGIIQPITLRKVDENKYQIISGERRFKASKLAGLTKIPAYVRDANDQGLIEMALVENIQREDLNPIEIALSYHRLIEECSITQENLSERVGKSRSVITNFLRLLKLPAEIQVALRDKKISVGHGRALITIEDAQERLKLFFRIVNEHLSVRDVEEAVRNLNAEAEKVSGVKHSKQIALPQQYISLKKTLADQFKTKIEFKRSDDGKGKIVIPFASDEELEYISSIFNRLSENQQNGLPQ